MEVQRDRNRTGQTAFFESWQEFYSSDNVRYRNYTNMGFKTTICIALRGQFARFRREMARIDRGRGKSNKPASIFCIMGRSNN